METQQWRDSAAATVLRDSDSGVGCAHVVCVTTRVRAHLARMQPTDDHRLLRILHTTIGARELQLRTERAAREVVERARRLALTKHSLAL